MLGQDMSRAIRTLKVSAVIITAPVSVTFFAARAWGRWQAAEWVQVCRANEGRTYSDGTHDPFFGE